MLNKLIGERDWSAQKVLHILLQLPVRDLSLFSYIRLWDWKLWQERSRAKPRAVNCYPGYWLDPRSPQYNDYFRVEVMLHQSFTAWGKLLTDGGCAYSSNSEAFTAFQALHSHPPNHWADNILFEDDSNVKPESESYSHEIQDIGLIGPRRPGRDLSQVEIDSLGGREIDL